MGVYTMKLPDVGEGVAEAELVEWMVAVGDLVNEDDVLAAVMTDKATVEIQSTTAGKVLWLAGEVGDSLSVGSPLVRLEVAGPGNTADEPEAPPAAAARASEAQLPEKRVPEAQGIEEREPDSGEPPPPPPPPRAAPAARRRPEGQRPLAPPSVRLRAREAGADLRRVAGSGPAGRITHDDLTAYLEGGESGPAAGGRPDGSVTETKIVGLRRRIAERMALSASRIPHITIVEEVDVEELEKLRAALNAEGGDAAARLTLLPLIVRALVVARRDHPEVNARFDDEAGILRQYGGLHCGIATQTPAGLMVPVIRHAEALTLRETAAELARLAAAARSGTASREELTGSTITITSLGPLGALATTPIINHPEVAIVGVNKMVVRPHWTGTAFVPRKCMNLSCSFDHRIVDGWEAALFVQRLKTLLETPALLFVES